MATESTLSLVRENYPVIARDLLGPLLNLLSLAREAFEGDLDKLLIILVVAIRTTEHKDFPRYTQAQLLSGEVPVFPSLGTNIRSVAESLHIPKETARRKVADLVQAGWIVRQGNDLCFTAGGYQQIAHLRETLEAVAVDYFEVVSELVQRRGR